MRIDRQCEGARTETGSKEAGSTGGSEAGSDANLGWQLNIIDVREMRAKRIVLKDQKQHLLHRKVFLDPNSLPGRKEKANTNAKQNKRQCEQRWASSKHTRSTARQTARLAAQKRVISQNENDSGKSFPTENTGVFQRPCSAKSLQTNAWRHKNSHKEGKNADHEPENY